MKKHLLTALALALFCTNTAMAQVKLGALFTDNMVLQQKTDKAPIWGESKPGKKISVTTSWDGQTTVTNSDENGHWKTTVKTPSAGGPYTITVADGKKKTVIKNVMIGEVWICSGQSNMEMPVEGWGKIKNYEQEMQDAAKYPNIRFLLVKRVTSGKPVDNLEVEHDGWQVCNPQSIADFSACAYFFGRDINKYQNVPVGLIDTSWGGTIIESWISIDALKTMPDQDRNVATVSNLPATTEERDAFYYKQLDEWYAKLQKYDVGYKDGTPVWALPSTDISGWKTMHEPSATSEPGTINAFWWLRRTIDIPASWAGKDLTLNLGTVDDNDVTLFNGEVVGKTVGCWVPRVYTIPGNMVKAGKATIAIRVHDTGGLTGIGCEEKDFYISVKDSEEKMSLAGEWSFKPSAPIGTTPAMPVNTSNNPNVHTFLYNAMIHPIVPFTIKGAIWYQGESNAPQAYQYRELMPLMIKDWRNKWGYDFPFYMVQLANFTARNEEPVESDWAELREAQLLTRQHLEKVGMATIIDIGETNDIHPKNKQEVGRRLALAARATAYGERLVYEGPMYQSYKIEGNTIRLQFARNTARGMKTSDGGKLKGFAIAGLDRKWHWADAEIVKEQRGQWTTESIVVSCPEVEFPVAVRYAWSNNPECNLVNEEGLPASPFRTDDWPGMTFGNKR